MPSLPQSLRNPSRGWIAAIKLIVFVLCLVPVAHLAWGFFHEGLGANPVEAITRGTGDWVLRFLLVTLAITPLRKLTGLNWLLRLRRMIGLYAFFYCCMHFTTYIWLDQFFDWSGILKDIIKRPFITVGFAAFVLMIPLAATSANFMIRLIGGKRWQILHRAVYAISILGVLHYWWLVKIDVRDPQFYAVILAVLLGMRAVWSRKGMQPAPASGSRT